jgi:hypothetical protein
MASSWGDGKDALMYVARPGTPPGRAAALTRVTIAPGAVAVADVRYRSRGL